MELCLPDLYSPPKSKSFFLFGPRGTGKSSWVRAQFPNSLYFDLLESSLFFELTGAPDRLELKWSPIPNFTSLMLESFER
jgi:hypothetical protein